MGLPVVLQIVISLIFIYLVLSFLASQVQELLATLLQWRAGHLQYAVTWMLSGVVTKNGKINWETQTEQLQASLNRLNDTLANDPQYKNLKPEIQAFIDQKKQEFTHLQNINPDNNMGFLKKISQDLKGSLLATSSFEQNYPGLVPKVKELEAGVDGLLGVALTKELFSNPMIQSLNFESPTPWATWGRKLSGISGPSYLPSSTFAQALLQVILPTLNSTGQEASMALADLKRELVATPLPEALKQNLLGVTNQLTLNIEAGENAAQAFQKKVADWFDQSMERASGLYKRNVRGITLMLGFVLAVALNADTILMVKRLSAEGPLRSSLVGIANNAGVHCNQKAEEQLKTCMQNSLNQLNDLDNGVPFGWNEMNHSRQFSSSQNLFSSQNLGDSILVLSGWIATALAISMGATFWFDLLSKFINIRNTGPVPNADSSDTFSTKG